jgi:hypothetical protein
VLTTKRVALSLAQQLSSPLLHAAVFFLPKHGYKGSSLHTMAGLAMLGVFGALRILTIPLVPLTEKTCARLPGAALDLVVFVSLTS